MDNGVWPLYPTKSCMHSVMTGTMNTANTTCLCYASVQVTPAYHKLAHTSTMSVFLGVCVGGECVWLHSYPSSYRFIESVGQNGTG